MLNNFAGRILIGLACVSILSDRKSIVDQDLRMDERSRRKRGGEKDQLSTFHKAVPLLDYSYFIKASHAYSTIRAYNTAPFATAYSVKVNFFPLSESGAIHASKSPGSTR